MLIRLIMSKHRNPKNERGFSLVEIVFSMAIVVGVVAVTARGLAYSYASMTLQSERTQAINNCRTVIANARNLVRVANPTTACPTTGTLFPCIVIEWRDAFPVDVVAVAELPTTEQAKYAGLFELADQTYTIQLTDGEGAAAESSAAGVNTNPLFVRVSTQWTGPRGITYAATLRTAITDH